MGHRFYMDTYYTQSAEKRCKMYFKVEPYLTVSDFTKVEKDLDRISEKQTDIEERLRLLEKNSKQNNKSCPEELVLSH